MHTIPAHQLVLPRLAESVTDATVVSWLFSEGDIVLPGQTLVEVDTDKFVVGLEVESPCRLESILQMEGARVLVGTALARLSPVLSDAAPAAELPLTEVAIVPSDHATAGAARHGASRLGAPNNPHGLQLEPRTPAGARFCALVEEHATWFAARVEQNDRLGRFPVENFDEMRDSGLTAATVPEEFGGGGLDSLHDLAVGLSRMGRVDASTAIALNMQLASMWELARHWRSAVAAGATLVARHHEQILRRDAAEGLLHCAVGSESGTDILHPLAEARPCEGGYRITGRKIFGTLSEVADLFHVLVRTATPHGYESCIATLPRGTPGMTICGDWDAMGMRGSGSHTLVFDDCFVPPTALHVQGQWGRWHSIVLAVQVSGNIGLLGTYLGIAEAARAQLLPTLLRGDKMLVGEPLALRPGIQHGMAELEITLASLRAVLARIGVLADDVFRPIWERAHDDADLSEGHHILQEFQCAKWFVNRKAIEVVDQAMTLCGGAAYANSSPLARLYRDVRAGPFMQLFSPNEAFGYIGQVALGLDPEIK